jgi:phosphinothricin acetyltransferase
MVAAIEAGNRQSIALHLKLGFVQTGLMPEVGTKFGRWLDLVYLQLKLGELAPT